MRFQIRNPSLNPYVEEIKNYSDYVISLFDERRSEAFQRFEKKSKIIVDIGCGAGNFLRDYALLKPEYNFIGFETRFKRLVTGAKKFKKKDLTNVLLVQDKAEEIEKWLRPKSVQEINVNFPDPWPKRKQKKNRLLNNDYLNVISTLLCNNGEFVFKTDNWDYFKSIKDLIGNKKRFKIIEYTEDLYQSSFNEKNIPTEFEALFKNKGINIFYLRTILAKHD
jgi:tRNA (guanine-N7-)-methyltransferase